MYSNSLFLRSEVEEWIWIRFDWIGCVAFFKREYCMIFFGSVGALITGKRTRGGVVGRTGSELYFVKGLNNGKTVIGGK